MKNKNKLKVIISHDVDHLTVVEHWKDLFLPKYMVRCVLEFISRKISLMELKYRINDICNNRLQNIDEIMEFDKKNGIPSTFFLAVNKGLGLSYSIEKFTLWANRIQQNGFDVGVHGIAFEKFEEMSREYELFKHITSLKNFGIRMHYLRYNHNTFLNLDSIGYLFDSTKICGGDPFKINGMWEFPLHIMESHLILGKKNFQHDTIKTIIKRTKNQLDKILLSGIEYLTVLFHDTYFTDGFLSWKLWYVWLIRYLRDLGASFISYRRAIRELEE